MLGSVWFVDEIFRFSVMFFKTFSVVSVFFLDRLQRHGVVQGQLAFEICFLGFNG